jgi:hypothetical protein
MVDNKEKAMAHRVLMPVMEGKVIKSMEKRVHVAGDKFTTLMLIIFTDGSSMELTSVNFSDGTHGISIDQHEA